MPGRPSKATPEVVAKLEAVLATGTTIPQAAAAVGISAPTLKRWLRDGVVVRRQLHVVPDLPGLEDGDEPLTDEKVEQAMVASVLKAAAVDWRAARFVLQSRWPERWGTS